MPVYAEHMQKLLKEGINHPEHYDRPLEGFHFLVDAGNGGGGFFATDVLAPLGADITGMLYFAWSANHWYHAALRLLISLWAYSQPFELALIVDGPADITSV